MQDYKYLQRPRLLFATTFIWLTVTGGRFLAPFLEHAVGLTARQIGIVVAGQQIILTIGSALAGKFADVCERHYPDKGRLCVIGLGVTWGTAAMWLHRLHAVVAEAEDDHALLVWHIFVQGLQGMGTCMVFPVLDGLTVHFLQHQQHIPVPITTPSEDDTHRTATSIPTPSSSSSSSSDEQVMEPDNRHLYGRERLHGPLWWAVANLTLSPLLDRHGFHICYPFSILAVVLVWASIGIFYSQQPSPSTSSHSIANDEQDGLLLSSPCTHTKRHQQPHDSSTLGDTDETDSIPPSHATGDVTTQDDNRMASMSDPKLSLWQLLRILSATTFSVSFLTCIFCISSGQAVVDNLIFLFLEALGSRWLIMGVTVVIKIAAEVPVFYLGPYLLQRFGASIVLLLGCTCYLIRVLIYPFLPVGRNVGIVLFLEPLHGITYGASQIAMVDFVAQIMPEGYEASGQGLVYLFKDGGSVLGVLLGGWAEDRLGNGWMFFISALIVTIGVAILCLGLWYHRSMMSRSSFFMANAFYAEEDEEESQVETTTTIEPYDELPSDGA
eukprot:scaffold1289_cov178-Amphora_coffeaeformis.AAC.6